MAALALVAILVVAIPVLLRGNAADRLASMFGGEHQEAKESGEARSYLLKQSLIYTLQHPLFGIGLGQFPNYEGGNAVLAGKAGSWHETHNSFTEVSSECGIPAVIFFTLGIGSAMLTVNRTFRKARREGYTEIANASFCYLLSMVGFLVSITFLANAFRFYLPAMIGLAIALSTAAEREMSASLRPGPVRATGSAGSCSGSDAHGPDLSPAASMLRRKCESSTSIPLFCRPRPTFGWTGSIFFPARLKGRCFSPSGLRRRKRWRRCSARALIRCTQ